MDELTIDEVREILNERIPKASLPQLKLIKEYVEHEIELALKVAAMDPVEPTAGVLEELAPADPERCARCDKPLTLHEPIYENVDGDYVCIDCHTNGGPDHD